MLHYLLYHFCTPNHEYMTRVYGNTLFYKILGFCSSSSLADIKKIYYRLMRLCQPDKHPHISTISLCDSLKFTTFYLTNVVVNFTTVAVPLQFTAVTALTSAVCAIPAPFMSRVMISGPVCHARTHSYKM